MHRQPVKLLGRSTTLHPEHLVRFTDIDYQFSLHKISAECNLGRFELILVKNGLKQTAVEDNIPMIAYKQIGFPAFDAVQSIERKLRNTPTYYLMIEDIHHAVLKFFDGSQTRNHLPNLVHFPTGKNEFGQRRKHPACSNTLHGRRNLFFIIGTYIIKFHCSTNL